MAVSFPGRVEALLTVPTGGAAVSASNGAQSAATTVTIPAGNYYLTQAGGVSSLLDEVASQLNDNVQPYPTSDTALASAIGYGDWSTGAGWLCNETSGDLAAVFGSPSLTAVSSPTYSNGGPCGGIDKAVGFDSNGDAFAGGDNFDVTATDDLIVAWVGKHDSVPSIEDTLVNKFSTTGYLVTIHPTDGVLLYADDGTSNASAKTMNIPTASNWYVGIACIDRSTSKMRCGTRNLATGVTTVSTEVTPPTNTLGNAGSFQLGTGDHTGVEYISAAYVVAGSGVATGLSANLATALANFANCINSSWSASLSTTDGRVTIANSFWDCSIDWTNTTLRDTLGFEANLSGADTYTGTLQARSLWLPDTVFNIDDDPRTAPLDTDAIKSQGPTGIVITHVGNEKYKHTNARWEAVPINRYRAASADYVNGSFEEFWEQTQLGRGNTWQAPGSQLQIYYDENGTATAVGSDESISGWYVVAGGGIKDVARRREQGWTGYWTITFPTLVSSG